MIMAEDSLLFETQQQWLAWLAEYHASSPGIWLQFAKKGATARSLSYPEALDAALCYGWIDGQRRPGPSGFWLQRFTPRGERSIWSKINCAKAAELVKTGRMHPSGLAAMERAQQNGQWASAYDSVRNAQVPEDLAQELSRNRSASEFFETLSSQNRYAILFRLQTAKRPETRAKRLAQFVQMLTEQRTIHPQGTGGRRKRVRTP